MTRKDPSETEEHSCFLAAYESTASAITYNLVEHTSCHGLGHLLLAISPIRKLIWSILIIGSLVGLTYHGQSMLTQYFQYDVTTTYESQYIHGFRFPAVTVCNLNPLNFTKVKLHSSYNSLERKLKEVDSRNISYGLMYYHNLYAYRDWLLENKTVEERMSLGYERGTFIVDCIYDEKSCNLDEDFTQIFTVQYGNCFTFNHGLNRSATRKFQGTVGSQYGLKMQFFIGSSEYLPEISPATGIRMQIHQSSTLGNPHLYGFDLPVGVSMDIGVSPITYHRLETPYRTNCTLKTYNWTDSFTQYPVEFNYTKEMCQELCQQKLTIIECGCIDGALPISVGQQKEFSDLSKFCDMRNDTIRDCMNGNRDNGIANCDCQDPCYELVYKIQPTFATWPSNQYQNRLIKQLMSSSTVLQGYLSGNNVSTDVEYITSNVVEVHVYFKSILGEKILSQISFSLDTLFSDIGGQLGLWMGMSLLTIYEFFEYIFKLLNLLYHRKPKTSRDTELKPRKTDEVTPLSQ